MFSYEDSATFSNPILRLLSSVTRLQGLQTSFALSSRQLFQESHPELGNAVVAGREICHTPLSVPELTSDNIGPQTTFPQQKAHPILTCHTVHVHPTSAFFFYLICQGALSRTFAVSWRNEVSFPGAERCCATHRASPRSTSKVVIVPPTQITGSPSHRTVTHPPLLPGQLVGHAGI